MQRRSFLQASALSLLAIRLQGQRVFKKNIMDTWNIRMLNDNTGIFTEKGGTIGFHFSKEGITVIDAQFPDSAQHLIDELEKRKDLPYHLLINTHHHRDHTAGNIDFKTLVNRVLAHENSAANQKRVAVNDKNEDQQLYPTQTFKNDWKERLDNEELAFYYYGPAHTDGDAIIHLQRSNIAHVGDLVFNRRHPFVDHSAGASMKNWVSVLDKAMNQFDDKTVFICGHSGNGYDVTGSKEILQSFQQYLKNVLTFVGQEIKAGKSKEEILKATEIPGSPQWAGDGIERPLTAAFEELS